MKCSHVDIYLNDLTEEKQEEIVGILGDDFDYENEPIIEINYDVSERGEYEETRSENAGLDIFGNCRRRGWRK